MLVELLSSLDQAGDDLAANRDERLYAAELATKAWANRLTAGRSIEATAGACLYIAFRECNQPRPIGVVADIVDTTTSEISSLQQNIISDQDMALTAPKPSNYVPYLSSDLRLPTKVSERAQEMLDGICLAGNPAGIAAGALYLTAQDSDNLITMKEAAQATRLTKETVWQRVDDLRNQ
jgi:transcription initiation factor TFIIB